MNDVINISVHNGGNVGTGVMDAMVGDAVLREIVSADFFAAVAGADERFARLTGVFHFFGFFLFEKAGTEDVHGFDAVLLLAALVLHGDDDAGGQMSDADSGVGGIHTLTTVTTRAIDVDAEVLGINDEILLAGFG